jgi:hypothetical protein
VLKRTRLSLHTAVGTTQNPRRHPDDELAPTAFLPALIAAGQHTEQQAVAVVAQEIQGSYKQAS